MDTTVEPSQMAASPVSVGESSAEAKRPFTALVPPDVSKLKSHERAKYKKYMERSSPGVFIDPFARYKGLRGRPRKALIATFKLPSLSELDWFHPDTSIVQLHVEDSSVQPGKHSALGVNGDETSNNTTADDSMNCVEPTSDLPRTPIDQQTLDHSSVLPPSTASFREQEAQSEVRTASPKQQPPLQETDVTYDSNVRNDVVLPSASDIRGDIDSIDKHIEPSNQVAASIVESSQDQHDKRSLSPFRTVAGWTVINKTAPSNQTNYESPYAPNVHVETTTQTQNTSVASPATIPPVSSAIPTSYSHNAALRRPVKPPKPRPKAHTKRTKKQQTLGSALFFRRQIIWDIIALCNGVFPDQGEIGRPFSKLWDQRHGHVQGLEKPIASTVNETMRNMCINSAFGIKRMVFQVRMNYKKGPYLAKKAMIAYTHLDAGSPEVLKLAHNITNFSLERSQQYFPEEIRHLIDDTTLYYPVTKAPKDESVVLNSSPGELEDNIKEAKKRRYKRTLEQRKLAAEARKAQNAQVERVPIKKGSDVGGAAPGRRTRLASLNDKAQNGRRKPLSKAGDKGGSEDTDAEEVDVAVKAGVLPVLIWTKTIVGPTPARDTAIQEASSTSEDEESEEDLVPEAPVVEMHKGILTDPHSPTMSNNAPEEQAAPEPHVVAPAASQRGKKRVRIADSASQLSRKKSRHSIGDKEHIPDPENTDNTSANSDAAFSSEADDKLDEVERLQTKSRTKKRDYKTGRQRGTIGPSPTLIERLTGLTGNPDDPIYHAPDRKRSRIRRSRPWSERKVKKRGKRSSECKSTENMDDVDRFKKLFFTLVIASSMSGQDGVVDWGIVERVYISSEKSCDLLKTKKIWAWMQTDMAEQVAQLTADFQRMFLEAYEQGQVSPMEDPSTYDWTDLVRWAVQQCTYPDIPLPILREALQQFVVDESSYEILDRTRWYKDKVADRSRTLLQLQHSFVSPLHGARKSPPSSDGKALKARSWVRANTATPQALYDGAKAHDKLMSLGETALVSAVGDLVEKQSLRMRKLKRLLPGRNYGFTKVLARKYVRPFELSDFMAAVKIKKEMDVAFADDDPSKRFYSISRLEEDGSIAAIMTMLSEGTVKLAPQLPAVNNEFGAPLPRLSIWGFCEGDYIHRAIDRERLFWDIYVVPTAKYLFGNPLQPSSQPLAPTEADCIVAWPSLPEPPLPGKNDPDALLPIWSNIDGQSVTWPWWYRILNIVLQPLIFQPGATCSDIYLHCATHTAEMFEIELVLNWLESINAVRKTTGGGYIASPGFWATFGDSLNDVDDDWLGEHIKRKRKNQDKQQWREQYNLRHSMLQTRGTQQSVTNGTTEQDAPLEAQSMEKQPDTTQKILQNPKKQYEISQNALEVSGAHEAAEDTMSAAGNSPVAAVDEIQQDSIAESPKVGEEVPMLSQATPAPSEDVDMVDIDAEGEEIDVEIDADVDEDVDAEGEIDDTLY